MDGTRGVVVPPWGRWVKVRLKVVIGTHALFQDDVLFDRLGLVIVDEQHRFGVHQRLALREKVRRSGASNW